MTYSPTVYLLPTPFPENTDIKTISRLAASESSTPVGLLVLVPVAVVLIVFVVLGTYRWQGEQRNRSRLCQLWRRISRRNSGHSDNQTPRLHSTTSAGRLTALRGSTTMLIEDINRDVWDDDCEFLTDEMNPDPHQSSNETSSNSNSENYMCTVFAEVHSDPAAYQGSSDDSNQQTASSVHRMRLANILATDTDDEDVSTQMLDISRSNATSLSYYSVHSTTAPSHISQDTPNSTSSGSGDSAQEIVDVVQSEGFVTDTAVLRSGSSQLSLFTDHEGRECHTDPELSSYTPLIDGSAPAGANGGAEQQEMIIPLKELDNRFGVAVMWEDWEQEIQTVL